MFNVAERIEELRKERGWTIYKLSNETGLTQQAIHSWYNTNKLSVPSVATIEILCESFGIALADFFVEKFTVEVTPQVKLLCDNWRMLSHDERKTVDTLIKKLVTVR
jgi:transcriptional regulator with XRE-family HTH domain